MTVADLRQSNSDIQNTSFHAIANSFDEIVSGPLADIWDGLIYIK